MPAGSLVRSDFPFFTDEMWDYEFQTRFAEWLHARCGAARTCCLIGIRTQESFNRWRTIYSDRNLHRFAGMRWIRQWAEGGICNAYPLYDWLTTDVWTANGRFGWPYNRLYDLFYRAGVPLDSQRVASPFISPAISSLHLYKAIEMCIRDRFRGRVTAISEATGSKYALVPTDNSAGNFVKVQQRIPVRIDLEGISDEEMDLLRAGMMVETEARRR